MGKEYNNESIKKLSEIEKARKKTPIFFGTTGLNGCYHTITEIVANSVDEAKKGYGNKIYVTVDKDNSWTVEDEGRGLPMAYNKKEKTENYKLNLEVLFAGGKMEDDGTYEMALGTNGCGLCATNFTSEWCKVESRRDGKIYTVGYKEGIETDKFKEVVDKNKKQKTGTKVSWLPDLKVFKDRVIPKEMVSHYLKLQAMITKGVTFYFEDKRDNTKEEFYFEKGIVGYAQELAGNETLSDPIVINCDGKGRDRADLDDYRVKAEIVILFNGKKSLQEYYHNSSFLKNGGSPHTAKDRAMLEFFSDELKKKGLIKNSLNISDIDENMIFISNSFSSKADYEGQTKFAVDNKFLEDFLTENILKSLKEWSKNSKMDFEKVCKEISISCESRVKANETKSITKQKLGGAIKLSQKIDKFTECKSKDNEITECFFVEGDSASGTIKNARNSDFQSVYALRGKPKNVLKMNTSEILGYPILVNILKVIGTGIQLESKKKNAIGDFDINNRRFKKYIFATDSDIDGMHIQALLMTIFYRLMRPLIEEGYVYILNTPLFIVDTPDGSIDCYSDEEKDSILKKYGNKVKKISRYKGLGEFNADQFERFLKPDTRHLTQITLEDCKQASEKIELWMGKDSDPRKAYILKHGAEVKDLGLDLGDV